MSDNDEPRWGGEIREAPPPAAPTAGGPGPPLITTRPYVPGRVPWTWRTVLIGAAIAMAPQALLAFASLFVSGGASHIKVTAGSAAATVVLTAIVDAWLVLWAWRFSLRAYGMTLRAWGYRHVGANVFWVVPTALFSLYVVSFVHDVIVRPPQQAVISAFPHSTAGLILFIALACIVAPFAEETFFRGFVFQGLAHSWGPVWGAIVSAAFFAAVHLQLTVFIPLFALGLALAWVFHHTRSLWASIILHMVFNSIAVLAWALR